MEGSQVSLDGRNRVVMSYLSLSRDRRFLKLSEAQRIELIRRVLGFGDSIASEVKEEFGTSDPRVIVEELGLKVIGEDRGMSGTILKRSEYRPGRKEIIIYRDSLNQLMSEVAAEDLSDRLIKLLIAHELFHHLEHTRLGSLQKKFKVMRWKFGPLSSHVKIRLVSEVAAHAFAETLLDIKQSPMVFDYLTYMFYSGKNRY